MDLSHPTRAVHQHPDPRHTQRQLQSLAQQHLQSQIRHESFPPSKRRRSNLAHPSDPSATEPSTLSPSTDWQSRHLQSLRSSDHLVEASVPRTLSPDRVSRLSTASHQSASGPQLRKKPKSSSIKNTHNLRAEHTSIATAPSLSTIHIPAQSEQDTFPYSGASVDNALLSLSRANSQNLSPNQRRPPASHSSYGVETICGPPPSYSTQRTLSQERIRKLDRNSQSRMQTLSDPVQTAAPDDTLATHGSQRESASGLTHSSPDTTDTQSIPTPTEIDNMSNFRVHGEQRVSTDEEMKASSSDERRSEDLFLNIARSDAARPPPLTKTEKRRSRISIPFLSSNRSAQAARSSPIQSQFESGSVASPQVEISHHHHNKRASLGGYLPSTYGSRTHLVDGGRVREQSAPLASDNDQNDGLIPGQGLRRSSTTNTDSTRLAQRSSAGLRGNRLVSESVHHDRPKTGEQVATESTVSTTAPSTVWDELDDLKSRIHKLELTGKLPSSSAAAMASAERPRTATTAATTMSTSPKHKPSETNLPSPIEGVPSNMHPLLHEALDNARSTVSHEVYQKLQATAQDALQLVAMMNPEHSGGRNLATTSGNDRQIRRRAEGMCRGLTELAIALAAEAKPIQSSARPASREQSLPPNSMLRSRRYSNDPVDRNHAPTRVQSRLDSRRTSVHLGRNGAGYASPERGPYQSPVSATQALEPRINRSSTLLRKRGQGSFDGMDEQYDVSPSIRPGSRAMTDLGAYRRISRDQPPSSREYTSQYPLPPPNGPAGVTGTPSSSAYSTTFASRRKYASPSSVDAHDSSPVTPREGWGRSSTAPLDPHYPDVISEAGGSERPGGSRHSTGFTSRIGSSVGSRLRAVRAERSSREHINRTSMHDDHATNTIDVNSRRADHA